MAPSRALSAPSSLRPSQEHGHHLRQGTFLTDTAFEELENTTHVQLQNARAMSQDLVLSRKTAEVSQITSSTARHIRSSNARSKSSSSLVSFPRSKSASSSSGVKTVPSSKDRLLQKALFLHKEPDYYDCLDVKPGSHWFRALYQHVTVQDSHVGNSLLPTLDVSLVETLCMVNSVGVLVYSADRGVEVHASGTAAAEFLRLARKWNLECPEGVPIAVLKKPFRGYKNVCEPLNLMELEAALQRVREDADIVVFQRFVRPRNEPTLLRVAWRDALSPYGFRLKSLDRSSLDRIKSTDKKIFWTVSSDLPGFQATELKSIPTRVVNMIDQLAHFTQMVFGMQLSQLVVDVLQDDRGHYHMSQVKAFTAQPRWLRLMKANQGTAGEAWEDALRDATARKKSASRSPSATRGKKAVMPSSSCTMCNCSRPLSQLKKRMTPKMMLETEHHLNKRGVQLFHVARLRKLRLSDLTPVCDTCWSLYLAEAELCQAEGKLAKAVGIDLEGRMADEAYVPFGGVLSSVRSEREQADFGGVHKRRDRFRIHDPSLAPSQPPARQLSVLDDGMLGMGGNVEWPQSLRRGGEALVHSEDVSDLPVTKLVPSSVLQWRLMIHLNRLMDIAPLRSCQSRLTLRLQVPWQPDAPHHCPLPVLSSQANLFTDTFNPGALGVTLNEEDGKTVVGVDDGGQAERKGIKVGWSIVAIGGQTCGRAAEILRHTENQFFSYQVTFEKGDIQIHNTIVYFVFTNANSNHPLQEFLGESSIHFSIHSEAVQSSPPTSGQTISTPGTKIMSGELSLARMLDSNPDGFLAQTWVMMCREGEGAIQCQLKLALGLVCDRTVSTEYVPLRSYADAFVPKRHEYFGSEALPVTWIACIMGDKPSVLSGADDCEADQPSSHQRIPSACTAATHRRRSSMHERALIQSEWMSLHHPITPKPDETRQPPVPLSASPRGGVASDQRSKMSSSPFARREPDREAEPEEATDDAIDEVVHGLHRLTQTGSHEEQHRVDPVNPTNRWNRHGHEFAEAWQSHRSHVLAARELAEPSCLTIVQQPLIDLQSSLDKVAEDDPVEEQSIA